MLSFLPAPQDNRISFYMALVYLISTLLVVEEFLCSCPSICIYLICYSQFPLNLRTMYDYW